MMRPNCSQNLHESSGEQGEPHGYFRLPLLPLGLNQLSGLSRDVGHHLHPRRSGLVGQTLNWILQAGVDGRLIPARVTLPWGQSS